jgi:hypothetical protein
MWKAGRKSTPKHFLPFEIIGILKTEESGAVSIQAPVDDLDAVSIQAPVDYLPEFISIAHEAIRHFGIRLSANSYPKKEELVKYFQGRRLSNGTFISRHQAQSLATFCRPVQAMMGGNKKRVKPFNR